jgi:hypothetical protein
MDLSVPEREERGCGDSLVRTDASRLGCKNSANVVVYLHLNKKWCEGRGRVLKCHAESMLNSKACKAAKGT